MKITAVERSGIGCELGIREGDELLEVNGKRVLDSIDYRFHEGDPKLTLSIARDGEVTIFDIEKDPGEPLGIDFQEMKVLSCGNDCIFCFVDQNPKGLRKDLYFRDGDYRLSFMYGNYTTLTNAGPAILNRIIDQRLSPQYISVHATDLALRTRLMGLRKDDRILDKIALLDEGRIDMHTQIVLCPGINDGAFLEKTVKDLFRFRRHVISLAIVPVGLTDHRFGLTPLRKVDSPYAADLLDTVEVLQRDFRKKTGRAFVYPSDEFYIVAGRKIPPAGAYDGFPQIENGVGLLRSFLNDFRRAARDFPDRLRRRRTLTLATGELARSFMEASILPRLRRVEGLDVRLEAVPNVLFGRSVTVAGLLSGKCLYSALEGKDLGDLLLLPPDILNPDGVLLDDQRLSDVEARLRVPVVMFEGSWDQVFRLLNVRTRRARLRQLLPSSTTRAASNHTTKV
jgi:putative radical SAM enzyme (TIGR03279 family)